MSTVNPRFAAYPAFQSMFEHHEGLSVAPYLCLNNLGHDGIIALELLHTILKNHSDLTSEILALFADYNWRPHLVGAVSVAFLPINEKTLTALWLAFDGGSWVSPQLAAIAFLKAPNFAHQAKSRIEAGCPINRERLQNLDWATRHSAAGPGSFSDHSSKALSALVELCKRLPETPEWLEIALARNDIQTSLASDRDGGGRIAIRWLSSFTDATEGMVFEDQPALKPNC